jgi:hypothetical protein
MALIAVSYTILIINNLYEANFYRTFNSFFF